MIVCIAEEGSITSAAAFFSKLPDLFNRHFDGVDAILDAPRIVVFWRNRGGLLAALALSIIE